MISETTQKFLDIGAYLDLEAAAQLIESLFSKDELQAGYIEKLNKQREETIKSFGFTVERFLGPDGELPTEFSVSRSCDEVIIVYPHHQHLREGRGAAELYNGLSNVFREMAPCHFPDQDELNNWRKLYQDVAVVCKERGFDRLAAKIGVLNDLMELKCAQNLKDMGIFANRPEPQKPDGTEQLTI